MQIGFLIAAVLSAITCGVHTVQGSREITRPLLHSDMPATPRYTVFLAWHIVSLSLGFMTLGFAWAAYGAWELGVLMTSFAIAQAVWGFALQTKSGLSLGALPQWTAFAAISGFGIWGSVA